MTKSQGATTSTNPSTVPETTLPVDATYPTTVAGDAPIQHKIPDEYIPGESKILTSDNQATGSAFSITRPPSQAVVAEAAKYVLVDEDGKDVVFGSLLPPGSEASTSSSDATTPHTVVFFIRHFWCGSCQDFMLHSIAKLDPDMLAAHNVKVAIIGCGGWKNIKTYRALFDCPFPLYSDTSRGLYTLMGMSRPLPYTVDPSQVMPYNQGSIAQSAWQGSKSGLLHLNKALPGNIKQLGGEFVFSPGNHCDFAHRMTYGTNHMEAIDVLKYAGLDVKTRQSAMRNPTSVQETCELGP